MGTRGFIGFVVDGREKIAYNQFDSYPEGLGAQALTWVRAARQDMETLRRQVRDLRVVTDADEPTHEDVGRLEPWTDLRVGERSADSWYCLLRRTQGNPGAIYEGFQKERHDEGRFADREIVKPTALGTTYYPVALVASWPLTELPGDDVFVKTFQSDDEDCGGAG